jgi:hypothetical protein
MNKQRKELLKKEEVNDKIAEYLKRSSAILERLYCDDDFDVKLTIEVAKMMQFEEYREVQGINLLEKKKKMKNEREHSPKI